MKRLADSNKLDFPYLARIAAIAAVYVAFAEIGFSAAFATKQVSAVWPPSGIALAALLLFGYRVWPAIYAGAFVSNALSHEPVFAAAGIAIGNTLAPVFGVYLLRGAEFESALERSRDVLALLLLGAAAAMTISAANGVLVLAIAGIIPWAAYGSVWWVWWVGDAMGVLLVAPLILTWAANSRIEWKPQRAVEFVSLAFGLLATAWLTFMSSFRLAYPVYPFVIWSALRFRQRATALAIFAVAAIAVWGTVHNRGPFIGGSLDQRLIQLAISMTVLSVTGLVLGANAAERRSAEAHFEAAEHGFQVLAESVPQMVWTADARGWIDWYNQRWYQYTGQTQEEAAGWGWQRAQHPEDLSRVLHDWTQSIATGAPFDIEFRMRGTDGVFRWFLTRAEPLRDERGSIIRWYGTCTDVDDQKRALDETTRVADTLQAAFLPGRLPKRSDLRFDALYLAAGQEALVGGDWYDAFELPDGHIVISIGDVVGHGLTAAITAGRIRQGIFVAAFDAPDPGAMLTKVNAILHAQEQTAVTALVAVIDPNLESMRYASAGHPPPMIAGPNIPPQVLPYGGIPLGVEDSLDLENYRVFLERDAVLLFYTDGVTEFGRDIERTEGRLLRALRKLVQKRDTAHPAGELQREIMGAQKPADDAVLMVLQLSSAANAEPRSDATDLRKTWTFHSSDAYSAQISRHELMRFLRSVPAPDEELFRAELILGEALANTVEHAPGLVSIEIDWTASQPIVTISDTGPGLTRVTATLPHDELEESGRGLFLITTLAVDLEVQPSAQGGTIMRIVLPVTREAASPVTVAAP
jgi:PAS domain S-box-containing protein